MPDFPFEFVWSIDRSSTPTPDTYDVEFPQNACGLWDALQFGMCKPGVIVTVPPLIAVTFTNCCCSRFVRPPPPGPSSAHTACTEQTRTLPVSAVSLSWS